MLFSQYATATSSIDKRADKTPPEKMPPALTDCFVTYSHDAALAKELGPRSATKKSSLTVPTVGLQVSEWEFTREGVKCAP